MKFDSKKDYSLYVYKCMITLASILLVSSCATIGKPEATCLANTKAQTQELPDEAFENVEDLVTVDCLLPGTPIRLGDSIWMQY